MEDSCYIGYIMVNNNTNNVINIVNKDMGYDLVMLLCDLGRMGRQPYKEIVFMERDWVPNNELMGKLKEYYKVRISSL